MTPLRFVTVTIMQSTHFTVIYTNPRLHSSVIYNQCTHLMEHFTKLMKQTIL